MIGKHVIYIHIHKTGGSSVEHYFYDHKQAIWKPGVSTRGKPELEPYKHLLAIKQEELHKCAPQHWKAGDYREAIGDKEYERRFRFTTVRNPWDRMLSLYLWAYMPDSVSLETRVDDFNNFIISIFGSYKQQTAKLPSFYGREGNIYRNMFRCNNQFCRSSHNEPITPCADYFAPEDVNFVMRFENYAADWAKAIELYNNHSGASLNTMQVLHEKNMSHKRRNKPYAECYSREARNLVRDHFIADIERFGYKFENA